MKQIFIAVALILALSGPSAACKGNAGRTAMGVYNTTCKALTWICRYKDVICARAVADALEAAKKKNQNPRGGSGHIPAKAGSTNPE